MESADTGNDVVCMAAHGIWLLTRGDFVADLITTKLERLVHPTCFP
jgi:hypothetical protein